MKLITILEIIRIEEFIFDHTWIGRPLKSRNAIARAFVAKSVYNMATTRALLDRLEIDITLRRICGFENRRQLPGESTFSRAFDEFSKSQLPQRVHKTLIKELCKNSIIQHLSNYSTAIKAREKAKKCLKEKKRKTKKIQGGKS